MDTMRLGKWRAPEHLEKRITQLEREDAEFKKTVAALQRAVKDLQEASPQKTEGT